MNHTKFIFKFLVAFNLSFIPIAVYVLCQLLQPQGRLIENVEFLHIIRGFTPEQFSDKKDAICKVVVGASKLIHSTRQIAIFMASGIIFLAVFNLIFFVMSICTAKHIKDAETNAPENRL